MKPTTLSLSPSSVSICSVTPTCLWILQICQRNSCSIAYQLIVRHFEMFVYHVNATTSRDCTKNWSSNAFVTEGGPFMKDWHLDYLRYWGGFPLSLNILNFGILEFGGNVTDFTYVGYVSVTIRVARFLSLTVLTCRLTTSDVYAMTVELNADIIRSCTTLVPKGRPCL